ncbi:endolytic transglycosylase MltG [Geodermatophilus maliterrae]|uniref:Endolytic murein transglycosylase n=1 Tax=Geodermatophilus maliterrae TaxID=3162531 RepID=A0ABV3XFA7_9ACTN
MSAPVPPSARGRHAGPDTLGGTGRLWATADRGRPTDVPPASRLPVGPVPTHPGGSGRGAGLLERGLPVLSGRHSTSGDDDRTGPLPGGSQPTPPGAGLPPRPASAWSRLQRRDAAPADAAETRHIEAVDAPTEAHPALDPHDHPAAARPDAVHPDDAHPDDEHWDEDATGGLEVIGSGRRDEGRRRGRRARRAVPAPVEHDHHHDDDDDDHHHDDDDVHHHDDDVLGGYHDDHDDDHHDGSGRGTRSGRRRRSPLANLLALVVLAGVIAGVVFGGRALIGLVNPAAEDYAGAGTGTVEVRVGGGDTLSDIARTLVDQGVIASADPFVDAAEADPDSMGIQPGVYSLRAQMSGQAALDLLLDPASRLVSRVTVPEGFTVAATLQRVAEATGLPIEEVQAAAADTASLGLPAYANGRLEGFLFPATYDVEPDDTATEVLRGMVGRFTEVATDLQLEQRAAASGRSAYDVLVVASMIQSETRLDEERADVAQVVYNRLTQGIPLGIDATLAYGLQKNGNELTVTDLQTDSPYNTRTRAGLPPTPVSSPGEASLEAALAPTAGDLLYYVLESEDGRHFFTSDYAEFQAARQRCADAGLGCGG